jgi:nucleoside-diphosphate-sugar epimerase
MALVAMTGATGFVGSALARYLVQRGESVRLLHRSATPPFALPQGSEWVRGDLDDHAALGRLVEAVDAVVHCAGAIRGATAAVFQRTNVAGTSNLMMAVGRQPQAPHLVVLSSLAAREPGLSDYARSKHDEEQVVARSGHAAAVLRPPAIYGPGDKSLADLFGFLKRGWCPMIGRGRFSLLYIQDLLEAIATLLQQRATGVMTLHDGREGGYGWADVAEAAQGVLGRPVRCFRLPDSLVRVLATCNTALGRVRGVDPLFTAGKARELLHTDWVCDNADITAAITWQPAWPLARAMRVMWGLAADARASA